MINGRKSGRSRGRRKICCGAAALASCLPLCLTAAEAGEYSEVSTHQTITEETHNTEKTRFAVTDKEQNRGGALLLEAPYYLAGGSVFEGTQAAESGGAVYADSKGRIRGEGPLTFSGNNARDGGAVYLEASENNVFASGTSFTGNRSDGSGGALYISDGSRHSRAMRPEKRAAPSITAEPSYSTPRTETSPSQTTKREGKATISISARARVTPRSLPSQVHTASP